MQQDIGCYNFVRVSRFAAAHLSKELVNLQSLTLFSDKCGENRSARGTVIPQGEVCTLGLGSLPGLPIAELVFFWKPVPQFCSAQGLRRMLKKLAEREQR